MGARSSSTKNWGWVVTQKRCLNGPTISTQAPTQDTKLAAREYRINLLVALPMLSQGQPDSEKCCIVLESGQTCSLVAKLPQGSLLAICEFHATNEECYERGYGQVCEKLWCQMWWQPKHIRTIAAMHLSSADLLSIQFRMVSSYMKDLKKPLNSQNWGWALARGWVPAQDNTVLLLQWYIDTGI